MDALVTTAWLAERLGDPSIRVVDATWYLPTDGRDARSRFEAGHIPGAVYFDISEVCDAGQRAPHMLPSATQFAEQAGALGLGSGHHIVVYDDGEYAAARVWWMFRVFGHERISVIEGGMPRWRQERRTVEARSATPVPATFHARFRSELVRTMAQMCTNLETASEQVVDARPPARFAGELPEIRAGVASGHIPNSRNLHYIETIDPATGDYRRPEDIERLFTERGLDLDRPIIATCGSGVSACQLALALHLTGRPDVPVYDGSWAEWGAHEDNPKLLGRDA